MARPGKQRPWYHKLGFGLVFATFILFCVEGGLRAAFGPPPSPVQVHSGLDLSHPVLGEQNGWLYTQYQQTPVPAFTAEPQGVRVAFLGGSSVHSGSQIPTESEFPYLIGNYLGIEAINLGNPAVDSNDVVNILEQIVTRRWSAIVVYDGHNDFGNMWFQDRYGDISSALQAHALGIVGRLRLFTDMRRMLTRPDGSGFGDAAQLNRAPGEDTHKPISAARLAATVTALQANLRRVIWLCRDAHIPLVLVVPSVGLFNSPAEQSCSTDPCASQLYQQANYLREQDPQTARALYLQAWAVDTVPLRITPDGMEAVRKLAEAADGDGVWGVNAFTQLPQDPNLGLPAQYIHGDAVHFTASGHQAMAELLAPVIRDAVNGVHGG